MTDTITADASGARPVKPRRLHPGLALLATWFGFGYLYVGRIGYAIGFPVGLSLCLLVAGWTGLAFRPVGWYALGVTVGLWGVVQLVHPIVLAWSRPVAPPKPYNRWWWYVAWMVGLFLWALFIAAYRGAVFGFDHYYIPSGAMAPTIQPGDRIVVDTIRYRGAPPAFGDIVIWDSGDGTLLVKRVVGIPGDTIEFRGPLLVRNGSLVDEPYLNEEQGLAAPDVAPLTLGADEFFVVGDNRFNSNDSRYMGPIGRGQIFGRAEFIYFSSRGSVSWERFPVALAPD